MLERWNDRRTFTAHRTRALRAALAAPLAVALAACASDASTAPSLVRQVDCAGDNGGLSLPAGFCAVVVADSLGAARHMAVTPAGDLYVAINQTRGSIPEFGIVALRDTNGDGRADVRQRFNPGSGGSGIAWRDGKLFLGANDRVVRYDLPAGTLIPAGAPAVVVSGLPVTGDHVSKTVVAGPGSSLFVNIGSASNACQRENRVAQSPGVMPCPELAVRAGVWRFDGSATNQGPAAGQQVAMGYRNLVALALNPANGTLYAVQHGRDMLFENWPQFFSVDADAVLPSEEFVRIDPGSDNGWPYCYHDGVNGRGKVLAPEYGGNGALTAGGGIDCTRFNQPLVTFGAHWAPNGLLFYTGDQFPARYQRGAFIAFHGGFDRAPLPNEGYKVMFVPMGTDGRPSGAAETFADGFAGSSGPLPANAKHRPVGLAQGPDGSLYLSDDRGGTIWRVIYRGQ